MNEFIIFLIPLSIIFVFIFSEVISFIKYKLSTYYKITKNSYFKVCFDKGAYGEYIVYQYLKDFEKQGAKFLFNLYIPCENDKTSEIDILVIHPKGIFVIESKNYSGWIFGHEFQKYWTQTLPANWNRYYKYRFYNPVMQNKIHIKYLKNLLNIHIPIFSVIAFSSRCELKRVIITGNEIVTNYYRLNSLIEKKLSKIYKESLSLKDIDKIYEQLLPYSQVNSNIKLEHIKNIHKKI